MLKRFKKIFQMTKTLKTLQMGGAGGGAGGEAGAAPGLPPRSRAARSGAERRGASPRRSRSHFLLTNPPCSPRQELPRAESAGEGEFFKKQTPNPTK